MSQNLRLFVIKQSATHPNPFEILNATCIEISYGLKVTECRVHESYSEFITNKQEYNYQFCRP